MLFNFLSQNRGGTGEATKIYYPPIFVVIRVHGYGKRDLCFVVIWSHNQDADGTLVTVVSSAPGKCAEATLLPTLADPSNHRLLHLFHLSVEATLFVFFVGGSKKKCSLRAALLLSPLYCTFLVFFDI